MRRNILLQHIWGTLERIDATLVTRDPGNARSAEAYDGLRKQITQATKNRRIHVSHLLSLSDSIGRGAEYQLIKERVADFLAELGVGQSFDVSRPDFFEVIGGSGDYLVCRVPAVVETLDDGTISLVRHGQAERTDVAPSDLASSRVVSRNDGEAERLELPGTGLKIAIGITVAIIGFFFGWVIASTVQDDGSSVESGTSGVIVVSTIAKSLEG